MNQVEADDEELRKRGFEKFRHDMRLAVAETQLGGALRLSVKPTMTSRSMSELPGLKQFRTFCLICIGISLLFLVILSAITFVPSALWLGARASWVATLVALYFSIVAFRTHVIIRQLIRTRPQTFDRPAPEWITVPFVFAAVAVVIWPHR